jgi:hypothetical protein
MTGNAIQLITYLYEQDKEKLFDLVEHRKKRSLNSNSYLWKLINEIANVMRMSKEEVYLQMLKDYGQSEVISLLSSINVDGYFKYYEVIGESMLNGKEFKHIRIFKGSSEYDTREMSILLQGVVEEAEQLGIQTMTKDEIEHLKELWR